MNLGIFFRFLKSWEVFLIDLRIHFPVVETVNNMEMTASTAGQMYFLKSIKNSSHLFKNLKKNTPKFMKIYAL
jgi:hypothetical protein